MMAHGLMVTLQGIATAAVFGLALETRIRNGRSYITCPVLVSRRGWGMDPWAAACQLTLGRPG
jgi:hypothetical protein